MKKKKVPIIFIVTSITYILNLNQKCCSYIFSFLQEKNSKYLPKSRKIYFHSFCFVLWSVGICWVFSFVEWSLLVIVDCCSIWLHCFFFLSHLLTLLYSHLHHHSASQRHNINTDARTKTHEDFFNNILPLTLLQGLKGLFKGLHVRGCWRSNINFIFWPHCYDRHIVSLLFSWCSTRGLGVHSIGAFPRAPSVGCSLPYHIWSLAVWNSAGNCIGGVPSAPSVGCGLPYHIWSLLSGSLLATASGVSEVPLGRVWPSLPHLVSNPLGVCWQLLWDPNSTELNNNSTPTRSPTGSLKSNV